MIVSMPTAARVQQTIATDSAAAQSRRVRSFRTGAMTTYFATIAASTSVSRFT